MITLDDIEDMTDLTREEIDAIAEHEHVSPYDASLLGDYLMHIHHGPQAVQKMICEDIRDALHKGDKDHAKALFVTLQSFIAEHPGAARGSE